MGTINDLIAASYIDNGDGTVTDLGSPPYVPGSNIQPGGPHRHGSHGVHAARDGAVHDRANPGRLRGIGYRGPVGHHGCLGGNCRPRDHVD